MLRLPRAGRGPQRQCAVRLTAARVAQTNSSPGPCLPSVRRAASLAALCRSCPDGRRRCSTRKSHQPRTGRWSAKAIPSAPLRADITHGSRVPVHTRRRDVSRATTKRAVDAIAGTGRSVPHRPSGTSADATVRQTQSGLRRLRGEPPLAGGGVKVGPRRRRSGRWANHLRITRWQFGQARAEGRGAHVLGHCNHSTRCRHRPLTRLASCY